MQPQSPKQPDSQGGTNPPRYSNQPMDIYGNTPKYQVKQAPFIEPNQEQNTLRPPATANQYPSTPVNQVGQASGQAYNSAQPSPNPLSTNLPKAGPISDISESLDEEPRRRSTKEEFKNLFYTIGLFVLAPLFAIFMIVFVFQSYIVDGSSMEPTLQNGNRVFILKLPKSVARVQGDIYTPDRNEVIVFKKPTNDGTQLIKRVIGLPGERVVIKDGVITVYNQDNPNGFNPDSGQDYEGTLEPVDTGGEVIDESVEQGRLFVLGDNRGPGGSLDSHSGLGQVPIENIVGKLWLRYFPLSQFQVF